MARIFITTTAVNTRWDPYAQSNYERLLRAAKNSPSSRHSVALSPTEADCILFVGSSCKFHWDVLRSPVFKANRSKSIFFDFRDITIPRIPGIYMYVPENLQQAPIYEFGFYPRVFDNFVLQERVPSAQCEFLFSFIGKVANCPAVRVPVVQLKHPRAYLRDSWSRQSDQDALYASILARSKFVLCPRGVGPSSWRLFETMRAGRVPVIISDEWAEPKGLDWRKFSIRVRAADISGIPALLESLEDRAGELGLAARQAWERHFSLTGAFEWVADACVRIQSHMQNYEAVACRSIFGESFQPHYRKLFYREFFGETARQLGVRRLALAKKS